MDGSNCYSHIFITMKYTITDDRLLELFSNVVKEYSELEVAERSYDFYNSEKGRYADLDVYNYYEDVEEDCTHLVWNRHVLELLKFVENLPV